ncbi:hypothetical protein [Peredibacter starrii]|uniref:Uncharacterized protein n=1 Tax=Peredibacter starrii TaxID=28202 RepID=A0AAX4HRW9_9BACT|nr:hypothetical protein [Peredibacter starrii]WPU66115.1 hypothetical protein SOO65_05090 [Peredibacter starrii]
MADQRPYRRQLKNYLLNPEFQLKLLSYFVGLFVVTTLSLYSVSYLFFWRLGEKALSVGIPKGHVFFRFLANQKADLDMLFIALVVFNFLLLIGTGFIVSHRIAGPIFKLKRHLAEMKSDSENFKLRDKDFFKELEPLVDGLKEKMK